MIHLACKPSDPLDWNPESFPTEGPLLFRLDLGLESPFFPIDDEMHFQSLAIGLGKFAREIWPRFQERITGAVLYEGSADFSAFYSWTGKQSENWDTWRSSRPSASNAHMRRLFCADAFVHYFQMLSHLLPDEMPLYLCMDAAGTGSLAERHQLMSRERFEHFRVAIQGLAHVDGLIWDGATMRECEEKPARALCFPEESLCTDLVLLRLEEKMGAIQEPFRVIPEPFLTEGWEGVDVLYVLKEAVSPRGERKLKGFAATGGVIAY